MKNITLKSLFYDILLVSTIIFLFIIFNIVAVIYKMSNIKLWGILLCVFLWCILGGPLVIRYIYVKKVCNSSEKINAVIIDKSSSSFIRNGTYYKVRVKGTNTVFETSTKYGITSLLTINEEVTICIDEKNNEVIIINIK